MRRTYRFLGLEGPDFVPADLRRPVNATAGAKVGLEGSHREGLRRAYEPEVRALAGAFDDIDLDLWPDFSFL